MELVPCGHSIERETCPAGSKLGSGKVNIGHVQETTPGHPERSNYRVGEVERGPMQHHESDMNVRWMMGRDPQRPGMSDIRKHILIAWGVDQRATMTKPVCSE